MRRVPVLPLGLTLGVIAVFAAVLLLTWFGVAPFDNISVFLAVQASSFLLLVLLGVLGGAFLGMVLMHRIVQNREFTPLEQTMLEALTEVRDATERLERMEDGLAKRLETLEDQMKRQ